MSNSIIDASQLDKDLTLDADVVVIGTGAGGGFAADTLAQAGLKVIMVEAGGYYQSKDFYQNEGVMTGLYQQSAGQRSKDQAFAIFQGQSVGGSTTVNWTSSFRTPPKTLQHWASVYGIKDTSEADLAPFFQEVEERLNIHEWTEFPPNENNAALMRGCQKVGLEPKLIHRNVKGCANSGLCGVGCPIDAKQSMLITTIPAAMANGATLIHRARAERVMHANGKANGVLIHALDKNSVGKTGRTITVNAKHVVVSAGSIRSPGLLMRSNIPDPAGMLGKRTFLHPVVASVGMMPEAVNAYKGAPQSVYSDTLSWPTDENTMGYKLEVTPLQPLFALMNFDKGFGAAHAAIARRMLYMHSQIALLRDGFHPQSVGGTIEFRDVPGYGKSEVIDYPINDYLRDACRRALTTIFEVQFAAGSDYIIPWHMHAKPLRTFEAAKQWLADASFAGNAMMYGSAHVMGGCMMGSDANKSVVDPYGSHHHLENLSVMDGSVFPTSIGANPQLSVYGLSLRNARKLRDRLVHA